MKKILITSLVASSFLLSSFAMGTTTATSTNPVRDMSCVAVALEKRDMAIISAHDNMNVAIKNALTARKDSSKMAWSNMDKSAREIARKNTNNTFKNSSQSAHNALRESRKSAWNTFNVDMKACGFPNHGEKNHVIVNPTFSL